VKTSPLVAHATRIAKLNRPCAVAIGVGVVATNEVVSV